MKRKIISAVLAVSMIACLSSCGSVSTEQQNQGESSTQEVTVSSEENAESQENAGNPEGTGENQVTMDAEELYQALLKNEVKFQLKEENYGLQAGEYLLGDFIEAFGKALKDDYLPGFPKEVKQARLDCGLDGKMELGIWVNYTASSMESLEKYFVFSCLDGKVVLAGDFETYYRSYSYLNYAGIVQYGGSNSATSIGCDYYMITPEGKTEYVYGFNEECLGESGVLPPYFISGEVPEWYEFEWDDVDGSAYLDSYSFESYADYMDYDEYLSQVVYCIQDENEKDMVLPDEYMKLYKENGMNFVTGEELNKLIQSRKEALHITDEMFDAKELEWTGVQVAFPSREEAIAKKSDKSSPEAQVQVIMDHKKDWWVPDEDYTWNIAYMICDLDRNGRLELVSSKYNYYDDININRFYEITEDFTGLEKMEYDCETKWYDGEEKGWCPALQNQYNVHCIITDMGQALEGYNGPAYRYIIPTNQGSGDGYMENKIEMNVDNRGRVWTGSVGIRMGIENPSYSDVEGLDCTEEEYNVMEFLYYHDDEYEVVNFSFVMLQEDMADEDMYWGLLDSYRGFTHEPYTPDLSQVQ